MQSKGAGMDRGYLQFCSEEEIKEIITICDNFCYTDYATTGVLQTSDQIKGRIKKEIASTMIGFYGEAHQDRILERVSKTDICSNYQIVGQRNSFDHIMDMVKAQDFNKKFGTNVKDPEDYRTVAHLMQEGISFNDLLSVGSESLYGCLIDMNVDYNLLQSDEKMRGAAQNLIETISSKFDAYDNYSDHPEVNANIAKLKEFKSRYIQAVTKDIIREHTGIYGTPPTMEDVQEQATSRFYINDYAIYNYDPITARNDPDNGMLFKSTTEACCSDTQENPRVFLGIRPSDEVIVHEFIHAVEAGGFEKGHDNRANTQYSGQYREFEIFNEVTVDYMAVKMMERREKLKAPKIVNDTPFRTSYSNLFPAMVPLLDSYMPELIETKFREFPPEEFMRIMGIEEFKNVASQSNEFLALAHDRSIVDVDNLMQSREQNIFDTFYEMQSQQSSIRKIMNFVTQKGEALATNLSQTKSPHLNRLASLAYGFTDMVNGIAQKHVARTLAPPMTSLEGFYPDLELEDENVMTMTMPRPTGTGV